MIAGAKVRKGVFSYAVDFNNTGTLPLTLVKAIVNHATVSIQTQYPFVLKGRTVFFYVLSRFLWVDRSKGSICLRNTIDKKNFA